MKHLDDTDERLLALLQTDAQMSAAAMSKILNLSASQISRRRQRLEDDGYITATVCKLDAAKLGLSVQAFIQVQTDAHTKETHSTFLRLVKTRREITGAWTMTGDADYLLRIYCADLTALNRFTQDVLLPHPSIGRVHSQIVMEQLKDAEALPV
ncbi:DNA-binding Lrp family transcriptional regulator [Loktanella ponticola]|uniref:DNA-binding Lrp family transcriptional regulator n=1 Tax=Yoonia ponticola TaxID=1524255 RepID=A0A7W9EYR4_9RHOB|nr:Lrp/AsnC family transcriptional regulator [Yoonia ponticola]MBB5721405.1 DNA-binding Lrp family transcriptional regulator [Yoonia ponticola]